MESNYSSQNNVRRGDTETRLPAGRLVSFMLKDVANRSLFLFFCFCTCTKQRDSAKTTLTALIYCVDLLKDSVAGEESRC